MGKRREIIFAITMIVLIIVVTMMECIEISKDHVTYNVTSSEEEQVIQTNSDILPYDNYDDNVGVASDTDVTEYVDENPPEDVGHIADETMDESERLILNVLSEMSLEEKVGQIFFIKNDGRFDSNILADYPVGGIILFAGDMSGKTAEDLKNNIRAFQEASPFPLLIGTDEEGGTVNRVSLYSQLADSPFRSPRDIYAEGGFNAIEEDVRTKSKLLLSYGINVNFAPVCDLTNNAGDFMYSRSFSGDAELTSEYISLVVATMEEENIGSVLKHFPGYGSNGDTHKSIVHDKREYEIFENEDFKPFLAGIAQGAECVLVSHNIVECMDSEWPASLSENVHSILRNDLAFDGVIITDDLMMEGVSDYVSEEEAAVQAIIAGNDMILSTYYDKQYPAVLAAVKDGTISEERIDESVKRILRWKYSLGLLEE